MLAGCLVLDWYFFNPKSTPKVGVSFPHFADEETGSG